MTDRFRDADFTDRELLVSVIEGAQLGVWTWNITTGETMFNERWAEIVGYRLTELEPVSIDTWLSLVHPDDLKRSDARLKSHWAGETDVYDCRCRMKHRDGHWVWVHDRGKVVEWGENGEPIWMAGTHRDVTEVVLAEQERERLQEQLLHAQKLESIGRVAGGLAHDYNNFLSVVMGYVELATRQLEPGSSAARDLDMALKAADGAAGLSKRLLRFSRDTHAGKEAVRVGTFLPGVLRLWTQLLGPEVELRYEDSASETEIACDPGHLEQVIANLLINARDAVGGAGTISVRLDNVGAGGSASRLRVTVEDDGPGVPRDIAAKIFEPFYTTKPEGLGTGLGLSTVRELVESHDGSIVLCGDTEKGARFRVEFPVSPLEAEVSGDTSEPAKALTTESATPGPRKVVVVDDDSSVLSVVTRVLAKQGYEVMGSSNPREALDWFRRGEVSGAVLITDVRLPKMSGPELVEAARKFDPSLRPLLMSGGAIQATADLPCLGKPFSVESLLAAVQLAADPGRSEQQS